MIVHEVKVGKTFNRSKQTDKHRVVYVCSADSDLKYRDMLVYGRHRWELYTNGSLDFTTHDRGDMSEEKWKQGIAEKISNADGVMMLVSENTVMDENALWQINCALSNKVPIAGVDIRDRFEGKIPEKLHGKMTRYGWEWFAEFINRL